MSESNDNDNLGIVVLRAYRTWLMNQLEAHENELQRRRDYLDHLYERWHYVQDLVRNGITHDWNGHRVDQIDLQRYHNRTYGEFISLQIAEDEFVENREIIIETIATISEALGDDN